MRGVLLLPLTVAGAVACSTPGCQKPDRGTVDAPASRKAAGKVEDHPLSTASAPAPSARPDEPSNQKLSATPPFSVPRDWPAVSRGVPVEDTGIFDDLTPAVRLRHPSWLSSGPAVVVQGADTMHRFVLVAGAPVAFAAGGEGPLFRALGFGDRDEDGIPDGLDVLIGAKKTVLNGASYLNSYRRLPYPRGDVPRDEGVCSDVIVRALRNAGFDLQRLIAEDIENHPERYPMVETPDPNIDHRRVRTLLPYFTHHWTNLSVEAGSAPFVPGDVCFFDTMGGPEPEHIGIVSDRRGPSGLPLIINNWNDGTKTSEMDLLDFVPVTHRYRAPPSIRVPAAQQGLEGLLSRRGIHLGERHRQLVLVTVPTWDSTGGRLRRYERKRKAPFEQVEKAVDVRIGARGLGKGRGLHDAAALAGLAPKQEGDRKAPAGLFALGTAFGPDGAAPYHPDRWPWRRVDARDRFVDDPSSPHYNRWKRLPESGAPEWSSAEHLDIYRLGLVVEHNTEPIKPGAGSAIFIHTWKSPEATTIGCTALSRGALEELLGWLDPAKKPVLGQVAGALL